MRKGSDIIELWKPIDGYEGLYEVSNTGKVRRISGWYSHETNGYRPPTGELKLTNEHGYMKVSLYKNGEKSRFPVHRLVAYAFLSNPNNYPQINHIDGNKANNSAENLEWCTQSQNNQHARDTGLCPTDTPKMRMARHNVGLLTQNILKINPKKPVVVKFEDKTLAFDSCNDCAKALNVSVTQVSYMCKTKGYFKKVGASFEYAS